MYHIDCYVDKDTIPTEFFSEIRSFALFNTNTDSNFDYNLFSWKLTVEDYSGKKVSFISRKGFPDFLTQEMKNAMEGLTNALPKKIIFDDIKVAKVNKTGGTTYLPGGSAVFYRGKTVKKCK